jgi:hypothetical protein
VDRAVGQLGGRQVRQVGVVEHVAAPHLDRVQAERAGNRVDRALRHPATDEHGRAVRAGRAFVRQDGRDGVAVVAQAIGARNHHADNARHVVGRKVGVGAKIGQDLDIKSEDRAVRLHGRFDRDDVLASVERGEQVLTAGLDPAYWSFEQSRDSRRHQLLAVEGDLLAEAAADVWRDDANGALWKA